LLHCCRCSLRTGTLYFGWLLPMSIIIVHNLVVFALVLRVLAASQPGHAPLASNILLFVVYFVYLLKLIHTAMHARHVKTVLFASRPAAAV